MSINLGEKEHEGKPRALAMNSMRPDLQLTTAGTFLKLPTFFLRSTAGSPLLLVWWDMGRLGKRQSEENGL